MRGAAPGRGGDDPHAGEGLHLRKREADGEGGGDGLDDERAGIYEKTIRLAGTEAGSETQRVRYSITGSQTGKALVAGCRVDADDTLTVLCLAIPPAAFDLSTVLEDVKR